jgi:hypothetical protein
MSSSRAIISAIVTATACVALVTGDAAAQTCSIGSAAHGPLSCVVTTTIHMSMRVPAMVGVTVTSPTMATELVNPAVRAGLRVKTNRSYALQVASARIDGADERIRSTQRVTMATAAGRGSLDETPTQIDTYGGPADDRDPIQLEFIRDSEYGVSAFDPIRLVLTIIAP